MMRRRIIFHGRVQGVGFRYRARYAAETYGCTGWAKNEWNGSVSMEIQGEPEQIELVIAAIEDGRFVKITDMEDSLIPVHEGETGFRTM